MEPWHDFITRLRPCSEAAEWICTQSSLKEAWKNCVRGDWMFWVLERHLKYGSAAYRRMVLASVDCVRPALKNVPKGEKRPAAALAAARRWAKNPTEKNRLAASAYAYAAYAYAASAAAYATSAYAYAASAAAASAASASAASSLKKSANIVRKYFPTFPTVRSKR